MKLEHAFIIQVTYWLLYRQKYLLMSSKLSKNSPSSIFPASSTQSYPFVSSRKQKQLLSLQKHSNGNTIEKKPQNIDKVYSMLNRQQEAIANLLNKYSDNGIAQIYQGNQFSTLNNQYRHGSLHQNYMKSRSKNQTIDSSELPMSSLKLKILSQGKKPITRQSSPSSRLRISQQFTINNSKNTAAKSSRQRHNESISLPIIYQKNIPKGQNKGRRKFISNDKTEKEELAVYFTRDKAKMENQLYRIYGEKNQYFKNQVKWQPKASLASSKQKKLKRSKKKSKNRNSVQNEANKQDASVDDNKQRRMPNKSINNLLDFPKNHEIQLQQDESQGQQIPTQYYERQFRDIMKKQCLQQINFLYFTKNQVLKDWTDSLLSLIEKHDKEITAAKKKAKYLENFDDKYFAIGIFAEGDL